MSLKDEKNNSFFIFKKLKQKIENDKKMRRNDRLDSIFNLYNSNGRLKNKHF